MRRVLALLPVALLATALLTTAQPAPRTVELQVGDTMRFVPDRITARPGERLHLVVKDTGTMPKTAMAHDFVLLKNGADPKAFADKSATARDTNYIAPALTDQVLASTTLVGPGETAETTFAAPAQAGQYTFICTFPGHFVVGMKGTLTVR